MEGKINRKRGSKVSKKCACKLFEKLPSGKWVCMKCGIYKGDKHYAG